MCWEKTSVRRRGQFWDGMATKDDRRSTVVGGGKIWHIRCLAKRNFHRHYWVVQGVKKSKLTSSTNWNRKIGNFDFIFFFILMSLFSAKYMISAFSTPPPSPNERCQPIIRREGGSYSNWGLGLFLLLGAKGNKEKEEHYEARKFF